MVDMGFRNHEFTRIVCRPVIAVGEGSWNRMDMLVQSGWDSFMPALRLREEFCGKELVARERKMSDVHGATYPISHGTVSLDSIRASLALDEKEMSAPGCNELLRKFRLDDEAKYVNFVRPYYEEREQLRAREIARHSIGLYQNYEETRPARLRLYKAVMKERAPVLGFAFDKGLSTSHTPVFSRDFIAPWRLCLLVDTRELTIEYVRAIGRGVWRFRGNSGASFDFRFGLVHQDNRGVKEENWALKLLFECAWFFPVANYPFHRFYKYFESLQEMEVVILFHLKMYSLIQQDFEKALYEGLSRGLQWAEQEEKSS